MKCFVVGVKLWMECFDVDAHAGRRVKVHLWTRSYVPLRTLNLTRTGEYSYTPI